MAASTVIKDLYDGTITLEDGTTPTAVSLTVPFSIGNLSVDGLSPQQRAVNKYETRGTFHSAKYGARTYASGSFSFQVADFSDASENTAIDFLLFQGSYGSNVSTLGTATSVVQAVKITLTVEGTDHEDASDHTLVMDDCVITMALAEGEPNTVNVSFEVLGSITWT